MREQQLIQSRDFSKQRSSFNLREHQLQDRINFECETSSYESQNLQDQFQIRNYRRKYFLCSDETFALMTASHIKHVTAVAINPETIHHLFTIPITFAPITSIPILLFHRHRSDYNNQPHNSEIEFNYEIQTQSYRLLSIAINFDFSYANFDQYTYSTASILSFLKHQNHIDFQIK